jgi:hypothetical protein
MPDLDPAQLVHQPQDALAAPLRIALQRGVEPQVEWLSTDALKPWPRNARTHFKRQINLIAGSIERFGFMNPILIDEEFSWAWTLGQRTLISVTVVR